MTKSKKVLGWYREHDRVYTPIDGESLTESYHKDDCDINRIMKKFETTGVIEHARQFGGQYGDFMGAGDYHAAMNSILAAQEMFDTVPAKLRARFGNDPAAFLEFVQDPENADQLVELGLANPAAQESAPEKPKKSSRKPKGKEEVSSQTDLEMAITESREPVSE